MGERHEHATAPSTSAVRAQLDRILANDIFTRSQRLSVFLRFVVEQTLDGKGNGLKEQVLGAEIYSKGPEFDGAADPIVRVDARRLRDKLREYYAEFPRDAVLISLPKGSYVPVFRDNSSHAIPVNGSPTHPQLIYRPRRPLWRWLAASIGLTTVTGAILFWSRTHKPSKPVVREPSKPAERVTVITLGVSPGISADGRFVAYKDPGLADIFVKGIDTKEFRRLTNTPQFIETFPAWSPNGREIAFLREHEGFPRDSQGIFVVPQSGGAERRICSGTWADWAPDGKSLVVRDRDRDGPFSIYQFFLETRERRQLTYAPQGDGDWRAAVSPDGSTLAFTRIDDPGGDLYTVSMQGGTPRRITNWNARLTGVVWTPDGRDLIYSNDHQGLWRISANLPAPGRGTPLEGVSSLTANNISISRPPPGQPARLVFQSYHREMSFASIDLTAPLDKGAFHELKPFPLATQSESAGPFNRDGQFAFIWRRPPEIWVSDAADANLHSIASLKTYPSLGSWSPDGQKLVYDTAIDGNTDLFVADTLGGSPKRLTFETFYEGLASWSRDGRWIYFSSSRAAALPDVWRMPAEGGLPVRITYHGGMRAREAPNGNLYYLDRYPPRERMGRPAATARLMRVAANGGAETAVLNGLTPEWWSMADTGIYFISQGPGFDAIDRYSFSDGKVMRVGRLPVRAGSWDRQLHVSPDGHLALVTTQHGYAHLMLLENIR